MNSRLHPASVPPQKCAPTFHCAHRSNHTQKQRSPSGPNHSPSVLPHDPAGREGKKEIKNRKIPQYSAVIPRWAVTSQLRARVRHRQSQRGLTEDKLLPDALSQLSVFSSNTSSVQSGERMSARKPITHSFPPDPEAACLMVRALPYHSPHSPARRLCDWTATPSGRVN